MATDKIYYLGKQQKLQQKLARVKDQLVVDVINLANRAVGEIQEIQNENKEIEEIIKKEEETKIHIKNKKEAK
uniref:Uncharacterized protein n=1 Tax=viral metagenome TaxID=1070528 RepID=A0A6M3XKP9_9ZZZZ